MHKANARRVLLKLSGEAFNNSGESETICHAQLRRLSFEIHQAVSRGIQVAIVVGAGNFIRGASLQGGEVGNVTADQMGMIATIMNALALRDALEKAEVAATVYSALAIPAVTKQYFYRKALSALNNGKVVILAGGTGNPFVTTDTAAGLRGIELGVSVLLKATKVDGVYSADPAKDPDATRYSQMSYDEVIEKKLGVMDQVAFLQCREHGLPIRVFNLFKPGALSRALVGEDEGTLVSATGNNQ